MSASPRQITRAKPHRCWLSLKGTIESRGLYWLGRCQLRHSRSGRGSEHSVEMQFRRGDPKTNISDLSDKPAPPSANHGWREVVLGSKKPVSMSVDSSFSTEPSRRSRPPKVGPLKFRYPPEKTSTHFSTSQSLFSSPVDRRFIITSLIFSCLSRLHPSFFITRHILLP